jgi:hypothetical protein
MRERYFVQLASGKREKDRCGFSGGHLEVNHVQAEKNDEGGKSRSFIAVDERVLK